MGQDSNGTHKCKCGDTLKNTYSMARHLSRNSTTCLASYTEEELFDQHSISLPDIPAPPAAPLPRPASVGGRLVGNSQWQPPTHGEPPPVPSHNTSPQHASKRARMSPSSDEDLGFESGDQGFDGTEASRSDESTPPSATPGAATARPAAPEGDVSPRGEDQGFGSDYQGFDETEGPWSDDSRPPSPTPEEVVATARAAGHEGEQPSEKPVLLYDVLRSMKVDELLKWFDDEPPYKPVEVSPLGGPRVQVGKSCRLGLCSSAPVVGGCGAGTESRS